MDLPPSRRVILHTDVNSAYASMERVFNPKLRDRPVCILSNNDGCIVALTKDAKALGIKRGTPYFKIRDLCEKHDVAVLSSNYELYDATTSSTTPCPRAFTKSSRDSDRCTKRIRSTRPFST